MSDVCFPLGNGKPLAEWLREKKTFAEPKQLISRGR